MVQRWETVPAIGQKTVMISASAPDADDGGRWREALGALASLVAAKGARLIYGGHLGRAGLDARPDGARADPWLRHYIAWPVHAGQDRESVARYMDAVPPGAEAIALNIVGERTHRSLGRSRACGDREWIEGLRTFRSRMIEEAGACVVLGGKTAGYRGPMPGIAHEAMLAMAMGRPVCVLGGFGGCAADIAMEMGLRAIGATTRAWPGRGGFGYLGAKGLRNGLGIEANRLLANSCDMAQIAPLIARVVDAAPRR